VGSDESGVKGQLLIKMLLAAPPNCTGVFDGLSAGQKSLPSGTSRGGGGMREPHPKLRAGRQHKPLAAPKNNKSEVLLSLSPVFNCRSKLALQAGAACQQLLPGRLPGQPLGEGCPFPPPLLSPCPLLPQAGSVRAVNLPPGCCGNRGAAVQRRLGMRSGFFPASHDLRESEGCARGSGVFPEPPPGSPPGAAARPAAGAALCSNPTLQEN